MKSHLPGFLLLAFTAALGAVDAPPPPSQPAILAPDGNANFRVWTNTSGATVNATFRGVENGNVFLQTADSYVHRIPLERLIPEDQKLAQTMKPEGLGIPKDPGLAQAAAIIDKGVLMELTKAGQKPNPLASDEQFVRRVYLDLVGRIPTREETLAFINDASSSKRATVIDKLISSDGFSSRMYNYFSDMLRIADDAQKSKFFTYQEWLKKQIAENRPWNQVVHEMMTADGKLLENGATGYLLRDRGMRLDNLSLTLSTFLGANVSCAQCHDHPFADWTQRQFYEMAAFFGASDTYRKGGGSGGMALRTLREELGQQAFAQARRLMYANQLDIKDGEKNDTVLPDDYKYEKDGKPGDPVLPKLITWSTTDHRLRCYQTAANTLKKKSEDDSHLREVFADWMTSPDNPRFAMTISNRLWKLMFGVGIKEPVTDLDDPSAASNPALLHHLANEMVRVKFDLRAFMRLLCNTQTYQREAVTRELAMGEPFYFPGPILRRMTAEQAWDSCVTLAIGDKVDGFKMKRADTYAQVMNLGSAELSMEVIKEKLDAMQGMRGNAMFGDAKGKGAKKKGKRAAMMNTTAAVNEEGEYTQPEMMGGLVLARASELRQPERENHFLRMFGQSDRQLSDSNSEEGSVPQVLMLMNGEAQQVLSSRQALAVATAEKQEEAKDQVESLYLSFFSRKPTEAELKSIYEDINQGLKPGDLAWVLFNSREFVFVQ